MCECCAGWFHTDCQDLSASAVYALETYELPWICISCRAELKQKRRLVRRIDRQVEVRMKGMEKVITSQIDETEQRLTRKLSDLGLQSTKELDQKLEVGLKNVESNVTKEIGKSSDEVKKAVVEHERRVDRSHNVIMHNIPECEGGTVAEKMEHDQEQVKKIINSICENDREIRVERVFRLQRRDANSNPEPRPRLLLVRFEKKKDADLVMKNRFGLRHAGYPNTYINRDLSKEEREKEWLLRQELKKKGRETHMIFRGRVVPRNEQ